MAELSKQIQLRKGAKTIKNRCKLEKSLNHKSERISKFTEREHSDNGSAKLYHQRLREEKLSVKRFANSRHVRLLPHSLLTPALK
jgi:hypothetical protein